MTNPSNTPADAILRSNALIVLGTHDKPVPVNVMAGLTGSTEADLIAAMEPSNLFHVIGDSAVLSEAGWKFYREEYDDDDEIDDDEEES